MCQLAVDAASEGLDGGPYVSNTITMQNAGFLAFP